MIAAREFLRQIAKRVLPAPLRRRLRDLLARRQLGTTGRTAAAANRTRRARPANVRRIHVGSGPDNLMPDWWNVDIRSFPGVDDVMDATTPWPWADLEFVYGEHFLEHLPLDGAMRFLREAARALRPGGRLRLSTPGLEHVWVTHFDASAGRPAEAVIAETYRANRAFHGWGHQFLWSRPMLERALLASGFADLSFHDYGQSDVPELRDVERHAGWAIVAGWPSVWIVEAVRQPELPPEDAELAAEIEMEFVRHVRSGH